MISIQNVKNDCEYMTNQQIHRDLKVPFVKDEVTVTAIKYYNRMTCHPNELASGLMSSSSRFSRLRRNAPLDLCNEI